MEPGFARSFPTNGLDSSLAQYAADNREPAAN
jgi:hypothetical protein